MGKNVLNLKSDGAMNNKNITLLLLLFVFYGGLIKQIYGPFFVLLATHDPIPSQILSLQQKQTAQQQLLNHFQTLEKQWGPHRLLSEEQLLSFILQQLDSLPIELLKFEKQSPPSLDSSLKQHYYFEVRAATFPTLQLLHALEERFPLATLTECTFEKSE